MMYRGKRYLIIETTDEQISWLIENNIPYRTVDEVQEDWKVIAGDALLNTDYQRFLQDDEDLGIYIDQEKTNIKEVVQIFVDNEVMIDQFKRGQVSGHEGVEEIKAHIPEGKQIDLTKANHMMITVMILTIILFGNFIIKARKRDKRRFFDNH